MLSENQRSFRGSRCTRRTGELHPKIRRHLVINMNATAVKRDILRTEGDTRESVEERGTVSRKKKRNRAPLLDPFVIASA